MSGVLLSSAYLAPVEYYSAMAKSGIVYIENCDYYVKQTYRNRCHIASANGILALSIPIEKQGNEKILTREVRISDHNDWQQHHWRSIESAYNSTPFFEYYKDDLFPFYEKKWKFLWDFNFEIQNKILELIDLQLNIMLTDVYQTNSNNYFQDLRDIIHPKRSNTIIENKNYYQVFDQKFGFQAGLSIIDLLFNMGNESILILQ